MKVFFDQRQIAEAGSFSPSAGKPGAVVDSWSRLGIPFEVLSFARATHAQMTLAHSPHYVSGILDRSIRNGFGNCNASVAESLPWVCGSMIAAAVCAYKTGETCFSPTSGAHHAGYDHGGGFCTFNSLIMAARCAHGAGAAKVAIIDLDCHWGNGTQDIMDRLKLGWISHYSFGGQNLRRADRELWDRRGLYSRIPDEASVSSWLSTLADDVRRAAKGCDLIIFNAGVDSHVNDPLGGYLTTDEMKRRDEIVMRVAHEMDIPVALALAGGYQQSKKGDISKVLRLHDNTFRAAVKFDRGRFGNKYREVA